MRNATQQRLSGKQSAARIKAIMFVSNRRQACDIQWNIMLQYIPDFGFYLHQLQTTVEQRRGWLKDWHECSCAYSTMTYYKDYSHWTHSTTLFCNLLESGEDKNDDQQTSERYWSSNIAD